MSEITATDISRFNEWYDRAELSAGNTHKPSKRFALASGVAAIMAVGLLADGSGDSAEAARMPYEGMSSLDVFTDEDNKITIEASGNADVTADVTIKYWNPSPYQSIYNPSNESVGSGTYTIEIEEADASEHNSPTTSSSLLETETTELTDAELEAKYGNIITGSQAHREVGEFEFVPNNPEASKNNFYNDIRHNPQTLAFFAACMDQAVPNYDNCANEQDPEGKSTLERAGALLTEVLPELTLEQKAIIAEEVISKFEAIDFNGVVVESGPYRTFRLLLDSEGNVIGYEESTNNRNNDPRLRFSYIDKDGNLQKFEIRGCAQLTEDVPVRESAPEPTPSSTPQTTSPRSTSPPTTPHTTSPRTTAPPTTAPTTSTTPSTSSTTTSTTTPSTSSSSTTSTSTTTPESTSTTSTVPEKPDDSTIPDSTTSSVPEETTTTSTTEPEKTTTTSTTEPEKTTTTSTTEPEKTTTTSTTEPEKSTTTTVVKPSTTTTQPKPSTTTTQPKPSTTTTVVKPSTTTTSTTIKQTTTTSTTVAETQPPKEDDGELPEAEVPADTDPGSGDDNGAGEGPAGQEPNEEGYTPNETPVSSQAPNTTLLPAPTAAPTTAPPATQAPTTAPPTTGAQPSSTNPPVEAPDNPTPEEPENDPLPDDPTGLAVFPVGLAAILGARRREVANLLNKVKK